MARRSLIERDKRREELSARYFDRRQDLKKLIAAPGTAPEARAEAVRRLSSLPRDSSPSRRRSRDMIDGRPRGVLRRFALSRVRFRQLALDGQLPGIRKASW